MKKAILMLLVFSMSFFTNAPFMAASTQPGEEEDSVAYVHDYIGECKIKPKAAKKFTVIDDLYVSLYAGDEIMTGKNGTLEIVFDDNSIVKLDRNSRIIIKEISRSDWKKTILKLLSGKLFATVEKQGAKGTFVVQTKLAMAVVKGTQFVVDTENDSTLGVYEGAVQFGGMDAGGQQVAGVLVGADKEAVLSGKTGRAGKVSAMRSLYKQRRAELLQMNKASREIRQLRRSGKWKQYRFERRLKRVQEMKQAMLLGKDMSAEKKARLERLLEKEKMLRGREGRVKEKMKHRDFRNER